MAEYISFQPSDFFNTKMYTGTAAELAVTGVGFQPDMVWLKDPDYAYNHIITDAVRGATKNIYPNGSYAEDTDAQGVKSFDADGFTVGTTASYNKSGDDFVSWNWKAGTTSGISGGTVTPTAYSFNTTAGISILKYTGNNTSGATIAHGLGAVPEFILVKNLSTGSTPWRAYHVGLGPDYSITLNESDGKADNSTFWNDTAPTSTLITMGNDSKINGTDDYIMYIFASKKGYSRFGGYTGNGADDGGFIYTGFRPAYFLIKRTTDAADWRVWDNRRDAYNQMDKTLSPNNENITASGTSYYMDFLSNGIKFRQGLTGNASAKEYIYAAFAEFPIVSSNDVPGVAR